MVLVGEARDGTDAVQMAAQRQPDLLVMDFNLLMFDGIVTIRIILLTAERDAERLNAALEAGADVYLPQFTLSTKLAETIQRVRELT